MKDNFSFYEKTPLASPVSMISYPSDLGSDARGLSANPSYLKENGLFKMLETVGVEIAEDVEIMCPPAPAPHFGELKNLRHIAMTSEKAASAVEAARRANEIAIVLGGDHSVAIGSIAGASRVNSSLGVIWIDAHPDVHTPETTQSHNLHNMPAALALGEGHPQLLGRRRAIRPENFLFVGLKYFDSAEIDFLRAHRLRAYTMLDIASHGFSHVFSAIKALAQRVEAVWISMDMDSIDKQYAPGVAMPNTGGLTAREIIALAQYIGKTCAVAGFDIVEMLPASDRERKTAQLAIEIAARLLGGECGWYQSYMAKYEDRSKKATSYRS